MIFLLESSQIHLHVSQLEPGIQDSRLPWEFSKHKPGVMETMRTTHLTIFHISNHHTSSPGFMIITPSLLLFSIVFSNQQFSNCSSTTDVGFVQLLSHCFCGNRVFRMNTQFCCHLCCSGYTIVKIQSSAMYSNPFHLVLVFGHSSS